MTETEIQPETEDVYIASQFIEGSNRQARRCRVLPGSSPFPLYTPQDFSENIKIDTTPHMHTSEKYIGLLSQLPQYSEIWQTDTFRHSYDTSSCASAAHEERPVPNGEPDECESRNSNHQNTHIEPKESILQDHQEESYIRSSPPEIIGSRALSYARISGTYVVSKDKAPRGISSQGFEDYYTHTNRNMETGHCGDKEIRSDDEGNELPLRGKGLLLGDDTFNHCLNQQQLSPALDMGSWFGRRRNGAFFPNSEQASLTPDAAMETRYGHQFLGASPVSSMPDSASSRVNREDSSQT